MINPLYRRAIKAHPKNRYMQLQWIRAVNILRNRPTGSIWILDKPVPHI